MLKHRSWPFALAIAATLALSSSAMAQFAHPIAPSQRGVVTQPRPANIRTLALQNHAPEDARQSSSSAHAAFILAEILATLATTLKLRNTPSHSPAARWLAVALAANIITGLMAAFPYVFAGPAVQSIATALHPLSALALAALFAHVLLRDAVTRKRSRSQSPPSRRRLSDRLASR